MRRSWFGALVVALALASVGLPPIPPAAAASVIRGFTAAHSAAERTAEQAYKAIPSPAVARDLDAYLAAKTGLVGTTGDWRRVEYVVAKLRSYGLQPQVKTYYPYLSVPRKISISMTAPTRQALPTKEICRPMETDCADTVVGYNALSPAGHVNAPVVYVNYGTVADYQTLEKAGISVKGKIALVRYGGVFRGVKTKLAAAHGAVGVVIYSDPKDDGNTHGAVYPDGPWRAPDGIQRGSVQQLWRYGGDPLTPGYPATKTAPRINPADSNIAKIPTTPISYAAATPLLKNLTGPAVPKQWQGGLPFTYHYGPGGTAVDLNLDIDYKITPIWDVTATIPGRTYPDQVVYVGAHRDAWTYGSDDNLSGAETVLQIGRGLGQLLKTGWRPERTVTLATWDGEEYGLFGSTEYAEESGRKLANAVAYINMDGAAGRDFGATGVPSLDNVVYDTTKEIDWPGTGKTIYQDWSASNGGKVPPVSRLGSGSDYTAFFDRFGVPSVDLGAGSDSGDYHCSCDNFYMEDHFIDPGWKYHTAIAQEVGVVTMRMADADVPPLDYGSYAAEVVTYLTAFEQQEKQAYGSDVLGLSRDIVAAKQWQAAAAGIQAKIERLLASGGSPARFAVLTRALVASEHQLLAAQGLPERSWFRHQIYAPGVNSGYGTQKLPGINDALFEYHNVAQAKAYEMSLYASLRRTAAVLDVVT
jgi:N-acetylated-alpha-linked acidic dipeptidase